MVEERFLGSWLLFVTLWEARRVQELSDLRTAHDWDPVSERRAGMFNCKIGGH